MVDVQLTIICWMGWTGGDEVSLLPTVEIGIGSSGLSPEVSAGPTWVTWIQHGQLDKHGGWVCEVHRVGSWRGRQDTPGGSVPCNVP